MASTKRAQKKSKKSLTFKPNFTIILSLLLILAGAYILVSSQLKGLPLFQLPQQKPASQVGQSASLKPYKLYIPRMSKILYVSDGIYQNGSWTTTLAGVSFYTDSALPGKGNTVIYGHNTKDIIGGLWRIKDGDYIYIVVANGDFVKYRVYERKEIKPTQVEIMNPTADSILTLYTCSGTLDSARYVVVAKRV